MAEQNELKWRTMEELYDVVSEFLNPILDQKMDTIWDPNTWTWR